MKHWSELHLNPIEWWFIATCGLFLEYYTLKKGDQRTLSRVIWNMRTDKVGKWLLISSWIWLTYHFFFQKNN